jgi:4-amino-4-deoxy-L-arabinose transferase-like glycosyltransferase
MTPLLQDIVHKVATGGGARIVRIALAVLAVLTLIVGYNWRSYRNLAQPEAMDQAQLARNLAEGKGYTTQYLRPFSIFLVKRHNQTRVESLPAEQRTDLAQIKGPHPDLANPPVYPLVLAGLMKVLPMHHDSQKERPFWYSDGQFVRHQPDFLITVLNQMLLLVAVLLTFFLARRLFDAPVAWLSAGLLLVAEALWKFSVSGLSTMLLLVIFLGLVWMLVRIEAESRNEAPSTQKLLLWAALAGLLLGAGMLTRYSFGFLIAPVLVFVLVFAGRVRFPAAAVLTVVVLAIVLPWVARNLSVSGTPFGTAGYTLLENSAYFPGHKLERSLTPDFSQVGLTPLWWKFFMNARQVLLTDLPRLGGTWITGFFLVGLLVGFRSPAISRLRYWLLGTLVTLLFAQSLIRTATADDFPDIHSGNLLVLLLPLVVIYGVALFYMLLDQLTLPMLAVRYVVIGAFCALLSLPMLFNFLPPKTSPVAFPPYHPPTIQTVAGWMRENELVMSDVPAAVAWYGNRQSVALTLDVQNEFYTLNDYFKPVKALYLTPITLDAKFLSQWVRPGGDRSWGMLIISALTKEELPPRFPLSKSTRLPEQLFLSDWERWIKPATDETTP